MRRPTACETPHEPAENTESTRPGPFLVAEKQPGPDTPSRDGAFTDEPFTDEPNKIVSGESLTQAPAITSDEPGVFVFPASLEQIRYWTLDQLDGESTASNMAIAVRLEGPVDDRIVEQSVMAIVERHEALRTTFRLVDDQLSQVISEQATYNFTVTDLRILPESERAAEAAVEEHSHARAALATGPAFFARLIHLTDHQHILAFTMHHIVCDGWSNGILTRDFADFYSAFSQHREPALPDLPFQFADFTVWQQSWLESDAAEAALVYWRKHIRRKMPAVDLPTDRPRLAQKSYPGHIESTLLPSELSARLKAYCRAHDATMHQVLLAAFEALIARYANQSEFLVGSTIANRTQPGMENVVGRFANPQVILADVKGDPAYSELLRRVIEWSTESYAHQDLPFSRLMEEFQLDQAGATSHFLQVYFVYQKAFMQPQEVAGLKVIPRPSVSGGVNFDLLVSIVERAEGPRLQMEYNTVLFRPERIQSMIAMYLRILHAVMDDDALRVSELPLLTPQGEQIAAAVAHLPKTAPTGPSIAEWLDKLATRLGDSKAVVESDRSYSWTELQERSRAMAASLLAHGVSSGQTVAFRVEPGSVSTVAAWALMRIGAIALPMPASATPSEWNEVLANQRPSLALASAPFAGRFAAAVASAGRTVNSFDEFTSRSSPHPAREFAAVESSSPCWVAVNRDGLSESSTHGMTLLHLISAARALDLRSGDTVLLMPAKSATDAWIDLLLPLTAGATLLYPEQASKAEPSSSLLPVLVDRHQASFVFASVADVLPAIHERWAGDRRLNVLVRGDILLQAQVNRLLTTPMRLWALVSSVRAGGPFAVARVVTADQPVFQPLAGETLIVLDDANHPVPSGVFGELAVSGANTLFRTGYLARTRTDLAAAQEGASSSVYGEFTQDQFPKDQLLHGEPSPNQLSPDSITGHSSHHHQAVEIFDRSERLVRLHGYRLRLSELEEVFWQNPAISDIVAAVLPVNGTAALVAYYRPLANAIGGTESAVREHFRSTAPGLVAGAELIAVTNIPRKADGSADLAMLPDPGQAVAAANDEYLAPRDELESNLVAIWEDVLGVRPIGIRSEFFKLGGYSLMIVRLFARINKALGTALPITTIFNAPTVEQLADIVRGRAYYSSLVPVRTTGKQTPFFMIHSYLLYQGIPTVLGEELPFYGLRELDTDAANMTVEQRAATYLDAIRSVQPHGPYFIGGWCAAGPLAVETARQITASGEKVGYLVLFDSWRPGYSAELAREQAGSKEMALQARLGRKYRFHRNRWRMLSTRQKVRYVSAALGAKVASVRNQVYLKNWTKAEWLCQKFGLSLPHFMHNVSLTTLNSLNEYRGVEPYEGSLILIRAKEAPYFPGAQEHCGWNSIVKGGVRVLWAPGDHESMFLDPNLQLVGQLLRDTIAEAQSRNSLELQQHPSVSLPLQN